MKIRTALLFTVLIACFDAMGQVKDVITADQLAATSTGYKNFYFKSPVTGVEYTGQTAKDGNSIQLGYSEENSRGIITKKSTRKVKSISIKWKANSNGNHFVTFYGDNFAFKDCSDLYNHGSKNKLCVIQEGNNSIFDVSSCSYSHLGILASGIVYMDHIAITWGKQHIGMRFAKDNYEVEYGATFKEPVLKKDNQVECPIMYGSSNKSVAVVDENTGKITIKGIGETVITATCDETADYEKETAQYKLLVNTRTENISFDFQNPESFGFTAADNKPGAAHGWDIDITRSLVLDNCDVVVAATAPKEYRQPRFYTDSGNFTGLRCYSGGTVTFTVPKGIQIVQIDPKIAKTQPFKTVTSENSVSYSYAADAVGTKNEMCISSANVRFKGAYELNISDAGYATWCAQRPYVLPQGLQGGIVSVNAESSIATVDYRVQPGDIVAPGTALLIKGAPGKYTLIPVKEEGLKFSDKENLLRPAITTDPIKAPGDKQFFVFALKNNRLGFYWQKGQKGDGVQNIPNKAYLEVPRALTAGSQGFRLDLGEQTGLDVHTYPQTKSDAVYNLSGTKVGLSKENLPHGIYIINGKKIFVK